MSEKPPESLRRGAEVLRVIAIMSSYEYEETYETSV
jgi:hypothetical protein